MKKLIVGICCLFLSACAYTDLEKRVSVLEQIPTTVALTEMAGADARWRDGRTDEGSSNVDEITGMSDGDWVIVIEEDVGDSSKYFYIYDSSGVCSPAADGLQRIDGSGGGCWYRANLHPFHQVVTKTSNYTITPNDGGTIFVNTGATGNVTFLLPECESAPNATDEVGEGWWVAFKVTDTSDEFYVDPDPQDSIKDFSSGEAGEHIYADQVLGSMIKVTCNQCESSAGTEEDAYNFVSDGYIGTWTEED